MYQYGLGAKRGQGVACLQEINAEYLVDWGNEFSWHKHCKEQMHRDNARRCEVATWEEK